jgi:hypothetical protein
MEIFLSDGSTLEDVLPAHKHAFQGDLQKLREICEHDGKEVIKALASMGAKDRLSATDKDGQTAAHYAMHFRGSQVQRNAILTALFETMGKDGFTQKNLKGESAAFIAARFGIEEDIWHGRYDRENAASIASFGRYDRDTAFHLRSLIGPEEALELRSACIGKNFQEGVTHTRHN